MSKELKVAESKTLQFIEAEARITQFNIGMDGVELKLSKIRFTADEVRKLFETQQSNEPVKIRIQQIQTQLFEKGQ